MNFPERVEEERRVPRGLLAAAQRWGIAGLIVRGLWVRIVLGVSRVR